MKQPTNIFIDRPGESWKIACAMVCSIFAASENFTAYIIVIKINKQFLQT